MKRYYWLKLKDDFFTQKAIKKLRKIAGGDTFTIIYLKMMLIAMKSDGKLYHEGIENNFHEELALELDEDEENVNLTITYLINHGLMVESQNEYFLPESITNTGSESDSAERVKRFRENINLIKEEVKRLGKIPYIETYQDNKLYDGNYYYALKRDNLRCVSCDADENLNMHHIIGNRENLKESRSKSSLITLCRRCHSKEHANPHSIVTDEILKNIDFNFNLYDLIDEISNNTGKKKLNSSVTCNNDVTAGNVDVTSCNIEKEIEKEKRDREEKKKKNHDAEDVISYLNNKSNSNFRMIDTNLKLINAILKKGYSKEDCFTVVDKKCDEWQGTDMQQYIRPMTLFGSKFDSYLNQSITKKQSNYEKTTDKLTELFEKYGSEEIEQTRNVKNIFDI